MTVRDELEEAQARVRRVEQHAVTREQLELLADQLDREARAWTQRLEHEELRAMKGEAQGTATRVMSFGFMLLFVTPMVAIIGTALSRSLRGETALAIVLIAVGLAAISATLSWRVRLKVSRAVSPEWRLVRSVTRRAALLRAG